MQDMHSIPWLLGLTVFCALSLSPDSNRARHCAAAELIFLKGLIVSLIQNMDAVILIDFLAAYLSTATYCDHCSDV